MKLTAIASSLALTAAFIVGAAAGAPAALAAAPTTLTGGFDVGPGGFPGNFNPLMATAGFTWFSLYYEPLVIWDAKLASIEGDLAKSYESSSDGLSYTFKLADAKWQDGEPFTSQDVGFTIRVAKNSEAGTVFAARLGAVQSVETPDAHTAVFKLSRPDAGLLNTLTQLMMLPEHALAKIPANDLARNKWWSTTPIGTGPFKFSQYVTDQYVILVANPDYRLGKPVLDRLINRYFKDTAAAVTALKSGEILISYVEANDARLFQNNPAFRVIAAPSYVVNYIGFNQQGPLWKDQRVRQAVMYAINRDAIVKSLYGGAAKVANCAYTAAKYVPSDLNPYPYDPGKARQLLSEAGWSKINGDKPITLLTYYNTPQVANVLAAIQAMLAQVGINVVPRAVDVPTYAAAILSKTPVYSQFPLVFAGLQDGPDPSSINVGLNTSQIPPAGANFLHIQMPDLTNALNAALQETDPSKAAAHYQDVCRTMNADLPWATMWVATRYGVASTRLQNFVWLPAPAGGPYQANAEKWSIKP